VVSGSFFLFPIHATPGEMSEAPVVNRFTPGGYENAGDRIIPPAR
jgi:hypothetical protein